MARPTKKVKDLRPGDLVDLEGDTYADPDREDILARHEYAEVYEIERETRGCIRVDFVNFDSVGFPPRHRLRLAGED